MHKPSRAGREYWHKYRPLKNPCTTIGDGQWRVPESIPTVVIGPLSHTQRWLRTTTTTTTINCLMEMTPLVLHRSSLDVRKKGPITWIPTGMLPRSISCMTAIFYRQDKIKCLIIFSNVSSGPVHCVWHLHLSATLC